MIRSLVSRSVAALLASLMLLVGVDGPAFAQETQPSTQPASQPVTQPASQPATQPATQPASSPATAPTTTTSAATSQPAKKDRYLAVIHGRVHTVTGPVLDNATILMKNGRILSIGPAIPLPPECEVIDATGRYVYPGLVLVGATGFHSDKPEHTTDVFSLNQRLATAGGVTAALADKHVVKLTFGSVEDIVLRRDVLMDLGYSTRRPLERAQVRADLERLRKYQRDLEAHEREKERNKDAKPPEKDWIKGKFTNYQKLLKGELIATATANSADELIGYAELVEQFGFKLILRGVREGWTVPERLGRAGVRVVVTPRDTADPDERINRPTGSSIENARILRRAGLTVALYPTISGIWGIGGRGVMHLNMEAAFAVRGGMTPVEAVRAITIDAARMLGVDDRVGSIEVGKDADLLICDGDLLSFMTQVTHTVVNGRIVYDKSADTFFAHIRPDGRETPIDFDDHWPRKLEWPE